MSPRRVRDTFRWIPPVRSTIWTCTIGGTDIKDYILSGSFSSGLISEELICEIDLDNSGEDWTDKFKARDEIIFSMDFTAGTTVQWKGEVEEISRNDGGGMFKLAIKGAHYTSQLLDIMVTEEYSGAKISDIRKDLVDKYLSGFTYTNIEDNVSTIDIKFVNKPLLDCMIELDIQGDEDTYIDTDKDFHSFKRSSKTNDNEAVVWDDSLITLRGLGTDSAYVRNKVTIYGEAGTLPVIATSEDSGSQTTYRIKERVITDTSVTDEVQAKELGDAENSQLKDPLEQGSALCLFMPQLVPGYMTYVIYPPHKVHARYRVIKHTFKVPLEQTEVFFNEERSIPKLFKDRIKKDLAQETIVNPFKMEQSYNFTFDNANKIDNAASSNFEIGDSFVWKTAGAETAIIISIEKETISDVTSVHVLARGSLVDGATYWVQVDSQSDFQQVSLDTLSTVTNPGKELKFQIKITNADTRIDSAVVLYK